MEKEILIVNCLDDLLELKMANPKILDEELIKQVLNRDKNFKKNLDLIEAIGLALKIKNKNSTKTKREIISSVLEQLRLSKNS